MSTGKEAKAALWSSLAELASGEAILFNQR